MKIQLAGALGVVVGAVLGAALFYRGGDAPGGEAAADQPREPLYWVAPMDANYRRDQPGKSPMGMDLVPVYEEPAEEGTVEISPAVVNNLGVRTARVTREPWRSEIRTVGYVRYDEDRLVHIHPRVSGWVEALHVKSEGDPVSAGQPLYALYSPELVSAQEEYLLALQRQNQPLQQAAAERLLALNLSETFIDKLAQRRQAVQTVTFYALEDGVVTELPIREGFFVEPGNTMMSIGQLDQVWVEAEVFERQVSAVVAGLPVTMSLDYLPGRSWEGVVDYVYPSLDPNLRTARVRLRFANPDRVLKPNMFAQVVIHAGQGEEVLALPREALIRTGNRQVVVRALGEGRFRSVAVQPGRFSGDRVEILSGLTPGDEVVISAQFLIDSESSKRMDLQRLDSGGDGMDHGGMDHGDMDHGGADRDATDHENMDHGSMDHGEMDHAEMNHEGMSHD